MTSIDDLPSEILVHIFDYYVKAEGYRKFLHRIPRVCKRWNDLHLNPSLWMNLYFKHSSYDEFIKLGEKGILSFARKLCLDFPPSRPLSDENKVVEIIRFCHSLTELSLICCRLSRTLFDILATQCPNIKSIKLGSLTGSALLPDSYFEEFLKVYGKNLKTLYIGYNHEHDVKNFLSTVSNSCPSLEKLMYHARQDELGTIDEITEIDELVIKCPKLVKVELHGVKLVSSRTVRHSGFENMVWFDTYCVDYCGMDVYSLLKNSKNLEKLCVRCCKNMSLNNISHIPSEKVKILDFTYMFFSWSENWVFVHEAVKKWKRTLTQLRLIGQCQALQEAEILETYLHQNPNPKLKFLSFDFLDEDCLIELFKAAKDLSQVCSHYLNLDLTNREQVEEYLKDNDKSAKLET